MQYYLFYIQNKPRMVSELLYNLILYISLHFFTLNTFFSLHCFIHQCYNGNVVVLSHSAFAVYCIFWWYTEIDIRHCVTTFMFSVKIVQTAKKDSCNHNRELIVQLHYISFQKHVLVTCVLFYCAVFNTTPCLVSTPPRDVRQLNTIVLWLNWT